VVNLAANNSFATIRGQGGFTTNNNLYANSGTLNLGGNSQLVNVLNSSNPLPGQGGTVTSASAATVTVQGGGNFGGVLAGAVSLDKVNTANTLLLTSANTYTGSTLVRGGTLTLRDSGQLTNSSDVELRYATLLLDNGYLSRVDNRLRSDTALVSKGGTLQLDGRAGEVATQSLASVNLSQGRTDINSRAGGSGANVINIGNLVRAAGSGANVSVNQNYGFLGTAGNNTAIRNYITNINGSPLALNNRILPTWIIVNNDHFATYRSDTGISFLSNTADGYANYDSGDLSTASGSTGTLNYNDGGNRTIVTGTVVNAIRNAPGAAQTLSLNGSLNIASGGLLTNANQAIAYQNSGTPGTAAPSLTSSSGELNVFVNQNTTSLNVPITGNVTVSKSGGANLNLNPSMIYGNGTGNSVTSGSASVTLTSTNGLTVGMPVFGTGVPAGATIAAINSGTQITLSANATATGANTLSFPLGNTYTGNTVVSSGTLFGNLQGANGTSLVAVPGNLVINNATFTSNFANQISSNANVTITGSGRLNMANLASTTETLASITATDLNGTANLIDRTASQPTSVVNLTAATPITVNNTNPSGSAFIGAFAGQVGFVRPAGSAATLQINGPVATGVNNANGLNAVGLRVDAAIASVPTGVADGGLVKNGTGMLVLSPTNNITVTAGTAGNITAGNTTITVTSTTGLVPGMPVTGTGIIPGSVVTSVLNATTFTISAPPQTTSTASVTITGNPINFNGVTLTNNGTTSVQTPTFNIAQGVVRVDQNGALGSPSALTTVQDGAVLLGSNTASVQAVGSVNFRDGASLGVTINSTGFGAVSASPLSQSVYTIGSGSKGVTFYATDFFVQSTNAGTITLNGKLTGSGNINVVGPQITSTPGTVTLANPITGAAAGANDYSGAITLNTNTVLLSSPNRLSNTGATGSALGAASIVLNGGRLSIRDDASTAANVTTAGTLTYGNNVTLSANSFLDANRANGTSTSQTVALGELTVANGSHTLFVDSGNSYGLSFSTLKGSGTLAKVGTSPLTITAIDPGFTGGLRIAGAPDANTKSYANVGITNGPQNWNLALPAALNVPNYYVDGVHHPVGTSLTVSNTLEVGNNAGTITNGLNGVSSGSVTGAMLLNNTVVTQAANLRNNGIIGATGGTATLSAPSGAMNIRGQGLYQTNGQSLTLNGVLADDGVTPTRLKVAGGTAANDFVTLNATGSTSTGGAEVQSGRLVVNGGANPLGVPSTAIRVLGYPVATASSAQGPVNVAAPTLEFAGAVTQTGNIQNSGLVRVAAGGNTVLGGRIDGPGVGVTVPGLLEASAPAISTFDATTTITNRATMAPNTGNFGVKLEPRMLQHNNVTQNAITGRFDNDHWVYTGQFYDADNKFSIAGVQDDGLAVWVNGVQVIRGNMGGNAGLAISSAYTTSANGTVNSNGAPGAGTTDFTASQATTGLPAGWHTIEIRTRNGTGGAGGVAGNGFLANYGFGINPDGATALNGAAYLRPIDPGDGSVFRTGLAAKGAITIISNASLAAQGFGNISTLTLGGAGGTGNATISVTAAGNSNADVLSVSAAATGLANVQLTAGAIVDIGTTVPTGDVLAVPATKSLNITGGAGSVFRVGSSLTTALLNGTINVDGGLLLVNTNGGAGTTGTVNAATGGIVGGTGSITGALSVAATARVAPGELNAVGTLTVDDSVTLSDNSGLTFNLATPDAVAPGVGNDLLSVTDLAAVITLGQNINLDVPAAGLAQGRYDLIAYTGTDPDAASVANLSSWTLSYNGASVPAGDYEFLHDSTGKFVYLNVVVPEPTGLAAVGVAAIGLLARRRRNRR
jgi:autotransporter-associated beta strand protein